MPTEIHREDVRKLVAGGASLVEVLPAKKYEDEHLPGAINIPLTKLDQKTTVQLPRDRPMIVYCNDYQWDLSARAAWRLEILGFTQVFRYTAGKADWLASGLPREGNQASTPHAGNLTCPEISTCSLTERADEVAKRLQSEVWDVGVVTNDQHVVLGLVKREALASHPQATIEEVMQSGPATIRPSWTIEETVEYMQKPDTEIILVTTSDGELMGLLNRSEVERRSRAAQSSGKGQA
jgi:rhodanese-related sulfurtransferase